VRVGHGFDAHRLVEGRKLILGGVEIPFERGALAHSDGDALAHAIADALLGAAGLGDLGRYFPDTDARWKDAHSIDLLRACAEKVHAARMTLANVDATIVLEHPKLASHIESMREQIARALNVAPANVSVKAKTSEGLGFTGDGSGIAAYAVVALDERAR
jgi:2-C-methyl-D-erythritol 2,4-cyclodiphosphate synthase